VKSLLHNSNIADGDATLVDSFISRIGDDECGIVLVVKAGRKRRRKNIAISEYLILILILI